MCIREDANFQVDWNLINFQTWPNVGLVVFGLKMAAVSHLKNKKEARMRGKLDKVMRMPIKITWWQMCLLMLRCYDLLPDLVIISTDFYMWHLCRYDEIMMMFHNEHSNFSLCNLLYPVFLSLNFQCSDYLKKSL